MCGIKHKSKEGDQLFLHKERVKKSVCVREREMETEGKSNAVFGWRWVGAGCCISRIWAAISFPPFTSLSQPLPLSAGVWGTQGQALSCHLPPPFSPCPSPSAHLPNREQSPYHTTHGTLSHETQSWNIQHTDINIPPELRDQLNPEVYRHVR